MTREQLDTLIESLLAQAPVLALSLGSALLVLVLGWFVARWSALAVRRAGERLPVADRTLFVFLEKVVRVGVLLLTVIAALGQLGVPLTSFLALLGAVGLGIGLALKDTLSDLAAGLVLLVLRPFGVGDGVEVDGVEGTVQEIGLFAVRLLTWDGVRVTVPNARVWNNRMRNLVAHGSRRLDVSVSIDYGSSLEVATEALLAVAAADDRVLADPAPVVVVQTLAEQATVLLLRCWVPQAELVPARSDLTLAARQMLRERGVGIPIVQREVQIVQNAA